MHLCGFICFFRLPLSSFIYRSYSMSLSNCVWVFPFQFILLHFYSLNCSGLSNVHFVYSSLNRNLPRFYRTVEICIWQCQFNIYCIHRKINTQTTFGLLFDYVKQLNACEKIGKRKAFLTLTTKKTSAPLRLLRKPIKQYLQFHYFRHFRSISSQKWIQFQFIKFMFNINFIKIKFQRNKFGNWEERESSSPCALSTNKPIKFV